MGFFSLSHFVSQFPPTRFPLLTAIGMCHFLPVHRLEWHFGPGRRSKYNLETIQPTAFFKSVRILSRVMETFCHSNSYEKPSANADVKKNSQRRKIITITAKRKISIWTLLEYRKTMKNMKVTLILVVVGAHGTVTKGLINRLEDLEIRGRMETIQTASLLRSARILRRVLERRGDLLSLTLQWKTIR